MFLGCVDVRREKRFVRLVVIVDDFFYDVDDIEFF